MALTRSCICELSTRPTTSHMPRRAAGKVQAKANTTTSSSRSSSAVADAKAALKAATSLTNRGGRASSSQRATVEEAQVNLEALSTSLDFDMLPGKWKVVWTNAPDVAPLLTVGGSGFAPLQVGDIFQEFSSVAEGRVNNIIKLSLPYLLQEGEGVTVKVKADYSVRSARRIALTFWEAGFGDVKISPLVESLLAPAILPRGWLTHRVLLAIREVPEEPGLQFQVSVPLRGNLPPSMERPVERLVRNVGSEYLLTYLDDDTLIGRQTGPGGTFIFERAS